MIHTIPSYVSYFLLRRHAHFHSGQRDLPYGKLPYDGGVRSRGEVFEKALLLLRNLTVVVI